MTMFQMPPSPAGRQIEDLFGNADKIKTRGTEIEDLGDAMLNSASALQGLVDGTDGNKGKAVDKLRDELGDVHGTLKEAGQLYKPTGPIVRTYGYALAREQESIEGHVNRCETLWETFYYLPPVGANRETRGTGGWFEPDAGSDEAEQQAQEDAAKQAAYGDWESEAKLFDSDYEDWEAAFDKAAGDIDSTLAGKIEDGFWDKVDGFVAGLLTVLTYVGIALAVVGLIIGGPFIAALGAIVGLVALGLTAYQYARGDATLGDVIFSVVGVIPFGSMTKGLGPFANDIIGGLGTKAGRSAFARGASDFAGGFPAFTRGFNRGIEGGSNAFDAFRRGAGGGFNHAARGNTGAAPSIGRYFGYTGQTHPVDIIAGVWGDGFLKNAFGHIDMALGVHNQLPGMDQRLPRPDWPDPRWPNF